MLEATAFEIRFKLPMDMSRQTFALKFQLLNHSGVVFLYQLVVADDAGWESVALITIHLPILSVMDF